MNPDGSNQKQLTTTAGANFDPTVSADGRTMVYVSKAADAALHLWKMNLDNGDCTQLTNVVSELRPDISPDGRWVVYMSLDKDSPRLWKTSIDSGEAAIQLSDKTTSVPRVAPDGRCRCAKTAPTVTGRWLADFDARMATIGSADWARHNARARTNGRPGHDRSAFVPVAGRPA